jgi:hypothetical protein
LVKKKSCIYFISSLCIFSMETKSLNQLAFDADLDAYENKLWMIALPIVMGGQLTHHFKDAQGEFLVPQFIRWHASNLGDMFLVAPVVSPRLPVKLSAAKRVLATALLATGIGVGYEAFQAAEPTRKFDLVDSFCYAAGSSVYYGLMRRKITQLEAKYSLPVAEPSPAPR